MLDVHKKNIGNFEFLVVKNLPLDLLPQKPMNVHLSEEMRESLSGGSLVGKESAKMLMTLAEEDALQPLLQRFWEIEDLPMERMRTKEEKQCDDIFVKNVKRDSDGRYEVRIPLKDTLHD